MNEKQINAVIQALQTQRNNALDAVAQQQAIILDLEEQLKKHKEEENPEPEIEVVG